MLRWVIYIVVIVSFYIALIQTKLLLSYIGVLYPTYGTSPVLALSALKSILSNLKHGLILLFVSWPQMVTWYFLASALAGFILFWPKRYFYQSLLEDNFLDKIMLKNLENELQQIKISILVWVVAAMGAHNYVGI